MRSIKEINILCKENGAAATFCFKTGNETAVNFHCTAPKRNLYLSKTFKNLQIVNMVSMMQVLGTFFMVSMMQVLGTFFSTCHKLKGNWND